MEYRRFFDDAISKLKGERRYRVFADLERDANSFPRALWRTGHGQLRGGHSQYPWQVAACRGGRLRAGRGLSVPHPREVGFHLRLCDLGRDRVRR